MLKFSCFITGEDYEMLRKETPKSKKKVNALATTVMIPVMMWFVNGYLLMYHILESSRLISLITALFCAILIFLVERNIVMSKGKLAFIMRILLGAVIAFLGSISLDEVVFKKDIDQQMAQNKLTAIYTEKDNINSQYESQRNLLMDDINKKYEVWNNALESAKKEADGTGGSGQSGVHGITRLKLQIAQNKEADYLKQQENLKQLDVKIEDEKEKAVKKVEANFANNALLQRIKAMFALIKSDGWMQFIYILFTAFLFFLEFIVVITKISWSETNYERKVELIEQIGQKRMAKFYIDDANRFETGTVYPMHSVARTALKKVSSSSFLF